MEGKENNGESVFVKHVLPEDNETVQQGLKDIKVWADEEKIDLLRNDDSFLLRFLRVGKYKREKVVKKLKAYHELHKKSNYLKDFGTGIANVRALSIVKMHLTLRKDGISQATIFNISLENFDYEKVTPVEIVSAVVYVYEKILDTEGMQRSGMVAVADCKGLGWQHFNLEAEKQYAGLYVAYPIRLIRQMGLNTPWLVHTLFDLVKHFYSEKIRERISFLGEDDNSLDTLRKMGLRDDEIPKSVGGTLVSGEDYTWLEKMMENEVETIVLKNEKNDVAIEDDIDNPEEKQALLGDNTKFSLFGTFVVVEKVGNNSFAQKLGLAPKDWISGLDDKKVVTLEPLLELKENMNFKLQIKRTVRNCLGKNI